MSGNRLKLRPLSASPRKMIAVQVDTSTGWGRRMLAGIFNYQSQQSDWDVWTSPKSFTEFNNFPASLVFDGAITYISNERQALKMKSYGIPIVNASVFDSEPYGIPNIPPDMEAPCQLAFDFFRNRGYRNFAYCGPTKISYVNQYANNLKKVVLAAGFSFQVLNVNSKQFEAQVKVLEVPCAILAWPRTVYQLLAACHSQNRRIPEELPILAQDEDDILNRLSSPPLSAIQVPAEQIGIEAARLLHKMISGEKLAKERISPKPRDIIERQSTNALAIDDDQLRQILHFIRNQFHTAISVDDIADHVGLSRRTMERRFRGLFGHTVGEEIRNTRLEKARSMLNETDLSVAEIGPRCGFSSAEYFIYVFSQVHGMTPIAFRRKNRGLD
jgi:LacI family transcriptional regulator